MTAYFKVNPTLWIYVTCEVEGEKEKKQASEEIAEEGDHTAGDALWHRVNRLNEKLEEDGNATVDEDAHQDTGGIKCGWGHKKLSIKPIICIAQNKPSTKRFKKTCTTWKN